MDEELLTQMGLLLTQLRFSRLALENIERSTAKYAGLSISLGAGGASALGAPPMQDGALKVHVVNLGDIAGPGIGDVLFGILGGAGRFLGGFLGGAIGGTISGVAFPYTVGQINSITANIVELLKLFGSSGDKQNDKGGSGFLGMLESINNTLDKLRDVLTGATTSPADKAGALNVQKWVELAQDVQPIVNGLIILAPLLTGTLASVLNRLPAIQNGFLDLLEFAVRNALRLRAVVFAVVIDTVALAGRLVAGVLGVISPAVGQVIGSVFAVIHDAADATFTIIRLLGPGLAKTINQLIDFLNNDVVGTLDAIGNTSLIKLVWHFTLTLPLIIPALAHLKGITLTKDEQDSIDTAKRLGISATTTSARPTIISRMPDFSTLLSAADQKTAVDKLGDLGKIAAAESAKAFVTTSDAITKTAGVVTNELSKMDKGLDTELSRRLTEASRQADSVGAALGKARSASSGLPQVDAVAKHYETWLTSGGLGALMPLIAQQLKEDASSRPVDESLLGRAALDATSAAPKPIPVEIDKIEIRLIKPSKPSAGQSVPITARRASFTPDFDDTGVGYVDPDLIVRI